jgi:hypothetical protein
LHSEYPIWRVLMSGKGIGLKDIEFWTLTEVAKFNALLDMEADHTAAYRTFHTPEKKG